MGRWAACSDPGFRSLYAEIDSAVFKDERWFADRGRPGKLTLIDSIAFQRSKTDSVRLAFTLYRFSAETSYYYYIPLLFLKEAHPPTEEPLCSSGGYYWFDAIPTAEYLSLLDELLKQTEPVPATNGSFEFDAVHAFDRPEFHLHGTSSNSLLFVSRRFLVKNYRRIYPGINPELRVANALTQSGARITPATLGFFQYRPTVNPTEHTLGLVMEYLGNKGTGWDRWGRLLQEADPNLERLSREAFAIGETTALLHQSLDQFSQHEKAGGPLSPQEFQERIAATIARIETDLLPGLAETGNATITLLKEIGAHFDQLVLGRTAIIHGDLHLEQILETDTGWRIIDFEGEPFKPINERNLCDSPLKDLATLLRSISYRVGTATIPDQWRPAAEDTLADAFITGYFHRYHEYHGDFLPDPPVLQWMIRFYQIERVIYECLYELKFRPAWFEIPRRGLSRLLEQVEASAIES